MTGSPQIDTAASADEQPSTAASAAAATEYLAHLSEIVRHVAPEPLAKTMELLLAAAETGHRVYVMGNGGSAAIASQFVCNLAKTAQVAGHPPIRAFAITDNTPVLTAWANDTSYDQVFRRQILALVERGDVVIAISASGRSPNIVEGIRAAREAGASTVGLLGFDGGTALPLVDVAIHIPRDDYGLVEDTHMAIGHALTRALLHHLEATPTTTPRGRFPRRT